jgi:purine-nucleoside phosphorylase
MPTPHNQAPAGAIAKTVLMPGDPLRAKFIAERFLESPKLVNQVRNMFAYTGTYQGKEVTVMGSGMGMPSIGIYAHELYTQYGVETIIRVGTCGAYSPDVRVYDVILAQGACTDSNFASQYDLGGTFSALSSYALLHEGYQYAKAHHMNVHVGNILSSDIFYHAKADQWQQWAKMGVLAVEMESYALFAVAAFLKKKALTVLTVSDSLVTHEATTPEERERHFLQMMELALAIA